MLFYLVLARLAESISWGSKAAESQTYAAFLSLVVERITCIKWRGRQNPHFLWWVCSRHLWIKRLPVMDREGSLPCLIVSSFPSNFQTPLIYTFGTNLLWSSQRKWQLLSLQNNRKEWVQLRPERFPSSLRKGHHLWLPFLTLAVLREVGTPALLSWPAHLSLMRVTPKSLWTEPQLSGGRGPMSGHI